MAITNGYCTRQDLIDRLSEAGMLAVANDHGDSVVREEEAVALDKAITHVSRTAIDVALQSHLVVPLVQTAGSLNECLQGLCIDLALEYVAGRKGRDVPESIITAADRARASLNMIAKTQRVPGLTYPVDADPIAKARVGRPAVANPGQTYRPNSGRHRRWQ